MNVTSSNPIVENASRSGRSVERVEQTGVPGVFAVSSVEEPRWTCDPDESGLTPEQAGILSEMVAHSETVAEELASARSLIRSMHREPSLAHRAECMRALHRAEAALGELQVRSDELAGKMFRVDGSAE